jgi:tRNA modification GTPase
MVLGGYKALLADTAGLRDTPEEIEAEGVRRARAWAESADLRLWLVDGSVAELPGMPEEVRAGDLCLITKRDLPVGPAGVWAAEAARRTGLPAAEVTARGPSDVAWLKRTLTERVVEALAGEAPPAATRLRHRGLLLEAAERLETALAHDEHLELAAEDVRLAARALDRITGRIDPEAVLGKIFSTFCIGK